MPLLLRSIRHTSCEVGATKFCDVEFQDPNGIGLARELSVYRVAAGHLIRCHSEHYAGVPLDPKGQPHVDLEGLIVRIEPARRGDGWPFRMTAEAHCNALFESDAEAREVATAAYEQLAARRRDVTKDQMREYVRDAVAANDEEWMNYLNAPNCRPTWRKFAGLAG